MGRARFKRAMNRKQMGRDPYEPPRIATRLPPLRYLSISNPFTRQPPSLAIVSAWLSETRDPTRERDRACHRLPVLASAALATLEERLADPRPVEPWDRGRAHDSPAMASSRHPDYVAGLGRNLTTR